MANTKTVISADGSWAKFGSDIRGAAVFMTSKPEDAHYNGRICIISNTYSCEMSYFVTDVIPVENRSPLLDKIREFFDDDTAETLDLRLEPLAQSVVAESDLKGGDAQCYS